MNDKPSNVIEALVAVSRDVDAIAKAKTANAGGTFKYRGIEEVLSACHDPFIRYGVVVVPQVTKAETIKHEVTRSNGKVGVDFEVQMTVNYRIFGPGGSQDFIDAPIYATGISTGSLGSGSAMSYAYKQLMFQLLCIPTDAAEDNEASHVERTAHQPVPEDFYGWSSKEAHDNWWRQWSTALKNLPDSLRDKAVGHLTDANLFAARKPKLPFHQVHMAEIQDIIDGACREAAKAVTPAADHSDHAIEVMADALDCDPLSPPEGVVIEQWMWDLAEVEDLDAYDWAPVIRATKCRAVGILSRAQMVADRLVVAGQEVLVPDAVKEIHGAVAAELRVSVLKQEPVF